MAPQKGILAPGQPMPSPEEEAPGAPEEQEAQADEDDEGNVTPEEQALYDDFVNTALEITSDPKASKAMAQGINAGDNPIQALATISVQLVNRIVKEGEKKQQPYPNDVIMHAGNEVMGILAEMAGKPKGGHDFTPDELESAFYLAVDVYRKKMEDEGTIDKDAIAQDLNELKQSEQDGSLEEKLPGLAEHAARMPKPESAPEEEQPPVVE